MQCKNDKDPSYTYMSCTIEFVALWRLSQVALSHVHEENKKKKNHDKRCSQQKFPYTRCQRGFLSCVNGLEYNDNKKSMQMFAHHLNI